MEALRDQPWPTTILARHPWGNPGAIFELVNGLTPERTVSLDPSALLPDFGVLALPQAHRQAAWVCSSLGGDQTTWVRTLGCRWPVDHVGRNGRKQVEVVQLYGQVAGCLVHPRHRLVGCGMWRHKLVHASRGGAVICADPNEMAELGDVFAWRPGDVEALTSDDRQNLAAWQRYELERRSWSREQLVHKADLALKRITEGA